MIALMEQENKVKMEQKRQPNLRKVMIWTFVVSIVMMLVLYMYSYVFPYPLKPAELERYFSHYEDFDYATSSYTHILRKGNTVWCDGSYVDKIQKWKIPGEIISINEDDFFPGIVIFRNNGKVYAKISLDGYKEFEIMGDEYVASIRHNDDSSLFVLDRKSNTLYEYFSSGKLGRQIHLSKKAKAYQVTPNCQEGLLIIEEKELIFIRDDKTIRKPFPRFGEPFLINYPFMTDMHDAFIIIYDGKSFHLYNCCFSFDYVSTLEPSKIFTQISDYSMFVNSDDGTYVVYLDDNPDNYREKKIFIKKVLDEPIDPSKLAIRGKIFENVLVFAQTDAYNTNLRWIEYYFDDYNSNNWGHQVIENIYKIDGKVELIFKDFDSILLKSSNKIIYEVPDVLGRRHYKLDLFNTLPYKRLDKSVNWFLDRMNLIISKKLYYEIGNIRIHGFLAFIGLILFLLGILMLLKYIYWFFFLGKQ